MQQTQVTTYTIMEYIKSHNLPPEDIRELLNEMNSHYDQMMVNLMSDEVKQIILRNYLKRYFNINTDKPAFFQEFNEFIDKVSI